VPGEDPRTRLLDAAGRLVARDGLTGLTTRRLAREAGVNHGLVHYHYGSIDAVVRALMEQAGRRWVETLAQAARRQGGFLDRWRALRAAGLADVRSGAARVRAELAAAAAGDPALRDRWAVFLEARRELLAVVVADMLGEYRLSTALVMPATALVGALLQGLTDDLLAGAPTGHAELDRWVEGWLMALADGARGGGPAPGIRPG
jgi:AcrR family transcriptional regulator